MTRVSSTALHLLCDLGLELRQLVFLDEGLNVVVRVESLPGLLDPLSNPVRDRRVFSSDGPAESLIHRCNLRCHHLSLSAHAASGGLYFRDPAREGQFKE